MMRRPAQWLTKSAPSTRMKPARQTMSVSQLSSVWVMTSSNMSRLGNLLWASEAVAMPSAAAMARPGAAARLERTPTISAG
ncbi:hypothetical protein D3C72_2062600 [compost metagenome]